MERWGPLIPSRASAAFTSNGFGAAGLPVAIRRVGRLAEDAWIVVLQHCALGDVASFARCCRRAAIISRDERIWRRKLAYIAFKGFGAARREPGATVNGDDEHATAVEADARPATPPLVDADDGFGDFVEPELPSSPRSRLPPAPSFSPIAPKRKDDLLMLFEEAEEDIGMGMASPPRAAKRTPRPSVQPAIEAPTGEGGRAAFIAVFNQLLPFYHSLRTHTTSSLIFTSPILREPLDRAHALAVLNRLVHSTAVSPSSRSADLAVVRRNLQSAADFFEGAMLAEFEAADERREAATMRRVAQVAWELNGGASVVQVFLGKRDVFYDPSQYNPLHNIVKVPGPTAGEMVDGLKFQPLDDFVSFLLAIVRREGELIAAVFPPEADVLIDFADRVASDVLAEYIGPLLLAAQSLAHPLFLLTTASAFQQSMRLVKCLLAIEPRSPRTTRERCEDVVFRMFEPHMDDYLQEEGEWTREVLERLCAEWDAQTEKSTAGVGSSAAFLTSSNPAQVKRTFMASFTKTLLLPVTVVPKTVATSFSYVTTGAFNAVVGLGAGLTGAGASASVSPALAEDAFVQGGDEWAVESPRHSVDKSRRRISTRSDGSLDEDSLTVTPSRTVDRRFERLQLLLSIDTALQLVQADRDCLKRVQTFSAYTGVYGRKVRDTVEEIFIVLLQTLADKHIVPGFKRAIAAMEAYDPAKHDDASSSNVAPLVQFLELAHIGDTIGQMVQVYWEREVASTIDRTDFLNAVVREKKRFESALDDAVAQGLNAGVHLLINQAEHVLTSRQEPSDFAPPDNADLDLRPTRACTAVIDCLATHCDMLRGATDKQILEVFNVEVGLRLHGILLKHLKRAMVSPAGGFQVIADINAYTAWVGTLRQSALTPYFTALQMVANLYIVDSPKDLAGLVKDVQRYGGTLRGEDAYELLQRRTDWRLLQKKVDSHLYGLSTEDCTIS